MITTSDRQPLQSGNELVAISGRVINPTDREQNIPNDTATVFRIGSVSKQFTATLIMLLREEGKLTLEDTAGQWLPGFKHGGVTIGQLLTHRSGLPDYTSAPDYLPAILSAPMPVSEIVRRFCQDSLISTPGAQFRYSNSGYAVLAAIAEKAAHLRYHASRKGLGSWWQAIGSAEGRATGGRLRHLLADPKSLLRSLRFSFR